MTVTPQGIINLCNVPLESDYKNELTFSSLQAQLTYFNSKVVKSYSDYTYIKKDNVVYVNENIDQLINLNYMFYINQGFTTKTYFCFISDMEYENENCTKITFETDVWQTYQFNIDYRPCFVEREHVNDDTVGLHTVPESIEHGEYISTGKKSFDVYLDNMGVVIAMVYNESFPLPYYSYGGIYSGLAYIYFSNFTDATKYIKGVTESGNRDLIVNMFMYPTQLVGNLTEITFEDFKAYQIDPSSNVVYTLNTAYDSKPTTIGSYAPKNKKLLAFPYTFFMLDNGVGNVKAYNYEDFSSNNVRFKFISTISSGGSCKLIPLNYKGIEENFNEAFVPAKFPVCSWNTDAYTNWLTQNSVNNSVSNVGTTLKLIGGIGAIAFGGGAGALVGAEMVGSALGNIKDKVQEKYEHSLGSSDISGNISTGDVNFTYFKSKPQLYQMTIKEEYARICDNYLSMFGYQINRVKTPNITGRRNWNYVKTLDCNFTGDIPDRDLSKIKQIFNSGVTLWHNPATIYNYNADNDII